jgi:hypothetical protein
LATSWEDVIEELPTEIRAELFPVEATTSAERASLFENALSPVEKKIFSLLGTDDSIHLDELVEQGGIELLGSPGGAVRDGDDGTRKADAGEAIHQNPVVAASLLGSRR